MKSTAEDFKDQLAGKQDKVAAVKAIKKAHVNAGLKITINRRKLAGGVKIYFTVTPSDSLTGANDWLATVAAVRRFSQHTVQDHFPEASLTSGGSLGWTISEY